MALATDVATVAAGVVAAVAKILLGSTSYQPGTEATALGTPVKIYRGWPTADVLDRDVAAGKAHVSVSLGAARQVTQYLRTSGAISERLPTITATVAGGIVTLGGTITAGDVVGIGALNSVTQVFYAHKVVAGDTLASIAADFATAVPGASAAGAQITIPLPRVFARTSGVITSATEVRRQAQSVRVTVWAPSPGVRDAIGGAIDTGIAGWKDANGNFSPRIPLGPYATGVIGFEGMAEIDQTARDRVWRRDLNYGVTYSATAVEETVRLLAAGVIAEFNDAVLEPIGAIYRLTHVHTTVDGNDVFEDAANHILGVRLT